MDLYHDNTGAQNLQREKEPSPRDTVEGVVLKSARPARHRITDSHCILSGSFVFSGLMPTHGFASPEHAFLSDGLVGEMLSVSVISRPMENSRSESRRFEI